LLLVMLQVQGHTRRLSALDGSQSAVEQPAGGLDRRRPSPR
jgi:hypothetical protein